MFKILKDCYDSKTDATWRFTQLSIYFKNLENCLFRELGVIQKICQCRITFFLNLSPSNIAFCNFFHEPPPPFSFTKTLKKWQILVWIRNQKEIYIYYKSPSDFWFILTYIHINTYIYIYIYIYIYEASVKKAKYFTKYMCF